MEETSQLLGKEDLDKVRKILEGETLSRYLLIKLRHNWESVLADLDIHPDMIEMMKKEVKDFKTGTTVQDAVILAVKDWAFRKGKEATLERLIFIFSSNNLQSLSDLITATIPSLQQEVEIPIRTNVCNVFCYDLWEMIFERIERPQDKLQFIRADPSFASWFEAKTMDHLFASVLPIYMKWVEQEVFAVEDDVPEDLGLELKQSILSSRLVSRRCCVAADTYLNSYWEKNAEPPSFFCVGLETKESLKTIDEVQQFLQEMGDHPETRAPLLSRGAGIAIKTSDLAPPDVVEEENKLRMEFFKKTGRFLHQLYLGFIGIKAARIPRALHTLKAMLETAPNLKTFGFVIAPAEGEQVWNHAGRGLMDGVILQFPDLPLLTSLQLDGMTLIGDDTKWFMNHFQRYFPQLTKLRVDNVCLWNDEYNGQEDLFPNLQSFTLMSIFNVDDDYEHALEIVKLLSAPRLKEFTLNLTYLTSERKLRGIKRNGLRILNERFPNCAPWELQLEEDVDEYVRLELKFSGASDN